MLSYIYLNIQIFLERIILFFVVGNNFNLCKQYNSEETRYLSCAPSHSQESLNCSWPLKLRDFLPGRGIVEFNRLDTGTIVYWQG